jgi:preprotein translocase subunit SecB
LGKTNENGGIKMVSNEKKTLSAPEYNEFLKNIELCDIYLKSQSAEFNSHEISGPAKFEFSESPSIITKEKEKVIIQVLYSLKAKCQKKSLFNLKAKYNVVMLTQKEIPNEFFEIFNKHSLPLHTFPYFRELVNSTISRMGLPPLILPLRKNLIGGPKLN